MKKILHYFRRKNDPLSKDHLAVLDASNCEERDARIKIVSYNIKLSKKIDKAIKLLLDHQSLNNAGILCLQEMTFEGVQKIAKALNYNYVYFPAAVYRFSRINMGNAILTKWKIIKYRKLALPHVDQSSSRRIAVQAIISLGDKELMVFSVHKEVFLKSFHRIFQIREIIQSIPKDIKYCVIAGDFNTFTNKNLKAILQTFEEEKFTVATGDVEWSYKHWYLLNKKSLLDHVFCRGMKVIASGHVVDHKPSDHLPIWAELTFE